jgi:threonylcarbamoyladenosine tRNA methylthiotransferase MtaB
MREARELVAAGHQELVLTGVNIGTYRHNGKVLVDVVRGLEEVDGLERIRISSIEPTTIGGALVKHMAQSTKLCHYLHIPLQSGDDTVLRSMRRKHTLRPFTKFLERTHELVPDIGFGTDIMAGYPGETDEQFRNTIDTLTNLPFFYFHVFTYSDREGTHSQGLENKVPHHVKKARTRELITLSDRKRRAFYAQHIGEEVEVLFEQIEDGYWTGYTPNYMRVHVKSDRPLDNKIQRVRLTALNGLQLIGELTTSPDSHQHLPFAV